LQFEQSAYESCEKTKTNTIAANFFNILTVIR
jgi:hypothetical protein